VIASAIAPRLAAAIAFQKFRPTGADHRRRRRAADQRDALFKLFDREAQEPTTPFDIYGIIDRR
jgi:hypothetical protein